MANNIDAIEVYMRACMKDMTMFGARVTHVANMSAGRYFLSRVQPAEVTITVREWWQRMMSHGFYEPPSYGLGDSDWYAEPYASNTRIHEYVKDVYVEGFRPELLLSAYSCGTEYPRSVIAVFGTVRNTGVCTVFLKHHCFFHALWLLYILYVEDIVRSLCVVNTYGRVYLSGQSGSLDVNRPVRVRLLGGEPCGLLDFTEPVVKGTGADEFHIRSYDDGCNGAIAVSMNLNMARRIRAFIPDTPSLFDII